MTVRYQTRGTCARQITFDLEDGIVRNVRFDGGCSGNAKGVSALVEGMTADEAIRRLEVEDLPVIVIIDSYGNNLYETGRKAYLAQEDK